VATGAKKPSKTSPVRRRLLDQNSDGDEKDQPHPAGEENANTAITTTAHNICLTEDDPMVDDLHLYGSRKLIKLWKASNESLTDGFAPDWRRAGGIDMMARGQDVFCGAETERGSSFH